MDRDGVWRASTNEVLLHANSSSSYRSIGTFRVDGSSVGDEAAHDLDFGGC